ncbi:MAG: hypothetical protein LBT13_01405 [Treponema sp.]|nr:hypothetical protein [Treponema sp.]
MVLNETMNNKRIPADTLYSLDELYTSEELALMPSVSCGFLGESGQHDDLPYPCFLFDDDEDDDEDDIDEEDIDDLEDDFDDDFEDDDFDDDDYEEEEEGYEYEEEDYDDFDE